MDCVQCLLGHASSKKAKREDELVLGSQEVVMEFLEERPQLCGSHALN